MSWFNSLSDLTGDLKSGVKKVGKVAEVGAPALNFIPGVGPALAGGIGALGGLAAGDGLMGGLKGAFGGYGAGAMGLGSAATAGSGMAGVGAAAKQIAPQIAKVMGFGAISSALGGGGSAPQPSADAGAGGGDPSNPYGDGVGNANTNYSSMPGAGSAGSAGSSGSTGNFLQQGLGYLTSNPGLLQAATGLASGALQGRAQGEQLQQQLNLAQAGPANALYNQASAQPMRDAAQYMLTKRAQLAPTPFRPNDIFNGGTMGGQGQQGGVAPQMQQAAQGYTPGAGGVNTAMQKALLQRFGGLPS